MATEKHSVDRTDKARLAVDIGGTFTDVALELADGTLVTVKTLTTPAAPEQGFLAGVAEALSKAALPPSAIGAIIHGTTLATNALIEKRGAKTALLTTHGHRDALEMAYENRFEQYDINIDRPPPLVPRWLRLPVRERMNARGEVIAPLDEASVDALVPILEAENVESIAIGFLHAFVNPAHERRTAEIIAQRLPNLSITLASEAAPEIREYERQTTAVANAYVRPLMERYLRELERTLCEKGFDCPFLLITSGGGLCTVDTAVKFPIRLVESGPAGGAILASSLARSLNLPELLSFDMGGTTAKICLIDDFEPATARVFEVDRSYRFKKGSGMPVRIPVIEMVEIGAGGGSIAHIDALHRIAVGPESAGSEPGPACYGRGGSRPAVTDADLVLGKIAPEGFASGAMTLDVAAATAAIMKEVGGPAGLDVDVAAFAVTDVVGENMAAAARAHAVEQGKDIRTRTIVAFGGAAPLHAARLAEKLGCQRVIVPAGAGVGSAIGFLLAPAAYEVIRSMPLVIDEIDAESVANLLGEMRVEACAVVQAAVGDGALTETRTAYMRYAGQGYEVATSLDGAELSADDLRMRFEDAYKALYGRTIPNMPIECLTWSVRVTAPNAHTPSPPKAIERSKIAPTGSRRVFDSSRAERLGYAFYERQALIPGVEISGPALITEQQTTTIVSAAFDAHIDGAGNIILTRKSAA
jgi:N-methylhydantoinase A